MSDNEDSNKGFVGLLRELQKFYPNAGRPGIAEPNVWFIEEQHMLVLTTLTRSKGTKNCVD